jgi:hypothetical protein
MEDPHDFEAVDLDAIEAADFVAGLEDSEGI